MPRNNNNKNRRLQRVTIRAERRKEPDWERFAWALLQYTKIVSARQAAEKAKRKRSP